MHVDAVFAFRRDDKLCLSADWASYMLSMHVAFGEVPSRRCACRHLSGATCALVRMSHIYGNRTLWKQEWHGRLFRPHITHRPSAITSLKLGAVSICRCDIICAISTPQMPTLCSSGTCCIHLTVYCSWRQAHRRCALRHLPPPSHEGMRSSWLMTWCGSLLSHR